MSLWSLSWIQIQNVWERERELQILECTDKHSLFAPLKNKINKVKWILVHACFQIVTWHKQNNVFLAKTTCHKGGGVIWSPPPPQVAICPYEMDILYFYIIIKNKVMMYRGLKIKVKMKNKVSQNADCAEIYISKKTELLSSYLYITAVLGGS